MWCWFTILAEKLCNLREKNQQNYINTKHLDSDWKYQTASVATTWKLPPLSWNKPGIPHCQR